MRTITKRDCQVLAATIKPSHLGVEGKGIYSRLFQEAYGVPFEMLELLREGSMSIGALEKKLKMSRRTIFRYLLALEETGCKVELDETGYRVARLSKPLAALVG